MESTHLSKKYADTLERIYQHPATHNLQWHDVLSLVSHLGTVEEKDNGRVAFTVNGLSETFHRSQDKDVSNVQQLLDIRNFLTTARTEHRDAGADDTSDSLRLLVVVNERETLVFKSEGKGSLPERLHPYDPQGLLPTLRHTIGEDKTSRVPENLVYYEKIAATLSGAEEILLMGNGTGASSGMAHLRDFLATHHPAIDAAIVGELTTDLESTSEGQMLQEARGFYLLHDAGVQETSVR